ncbi:Major allergen Pru av 1 [Sarracenia purpurea var. burkii]
MGVITYESEISSPIPPAKLFKAFVLDGDNLIPKILPNAIKKVEVIEGNGGPGTVKIITFGEASTHKSVKHKVDTLDVENFTYSYTIIEGDALTEGTIESITNEVKIIPAPHGGSITKNISHYHVKGEAKITEEQIKAGKEKASVIFKAVESYLVANPDAY